MASADGRHLLNIHASANPREVLTQEGLSSCINLDDLPMDRGFTDKTDPKMREQINFLMKGSDNEEAQVPNGQDLT